MLSTDSATSTNSVKCWGYNVYGQIGNGTTLNVLSPVSVIGLTGVVSVSAGYRHTCALLTDTATSTNSVKCWGYNNFGQFGNGSANNSLSPLAVSGLSGVTLIATGGSHTCGIWPDRTVKCWGYNAFGQVGNGFTGNVLSPMSVNFGTSVLAAAPRKVDMSSSGAAVTIETAPVRTIATKAQIWVLANKVTVELTVPKTTVTNNRVVKYTVQLKPTRGPAISKVIFVNSKSTVKAALVGEGATSYSVTVVAVSASGVISTWVGPTANTL